MIFNVSSRYDYEREKSMGGNGREKTANFLAFNVTMNW